MIFEKLRFYLFWRKYRNRLDWYKGQWITPLIYCISQKSFKISWENYKKFKTRN